MDLNVCILRNAGHSSVPTAWWSHECCGAFDAAFVGLLRDLTL